MQLARAVTLGCCLMAAASGLSAQGASTSPTSPYPPTGASPAPASAAPAAAAASSGSVSVADARLITLQLGMNGGLKLGTNSSTIGWLFGMDLTVTDSFSIGLLSSVSASTTYDLLKLGYHLSPVLGFDVYVGSDIVGVTTSTAVGVGVFYNVLKSKPDSGFATGLKVHLDYLVDNSGGFGKGDFVLGVISYFGL